MEAEVVEGRDDAAAATQEEQELPPPEAGEEVDALPKSGTVLVKVRGSNRFVELDEGQQIPVGTVVDTTKGRVTIVAAGGQQADFYDGIFRLSQGEGAKPLTTLTLVEALSCPKAGKAVVAARRRSGGCGVTETEVPDQGQAQCGDRGRDEVAGRGPLHEHHDPCRQGRRLGPRLRQAQDRAREGRQEVRRPELSVSSVDTAAGARRGSLDLRSRSGIRVGILGLIVAAAINPGVAVAADFNVTTTADGADGECTSDCTLREAVSLAGSADRVLMPPGNYILANGELSLNGDTIVGANARTTFIDGANKARVLRVIEVASRVSNVTIRNGNGVGVDPDGVGGGIFIHSGSLLLQNSTVSGNTGTQGAGIAAAGVAQLIGVTVSGNTATDGRLTRGGGIATDTTGGLFLGNSTVSGNTAVDEVGAASQGGGVHSTGRSWSSPRRSPTTPPLKAVACT